VGSREGNALLGRCHDARPSTLPDSTFA